MNKRNFLQNVFLGGVGLSLSQKVFGADRESIPRRTFDKMCRFSGRFGKCLAPPAEPDSDRWTAEEKDYCRQLAANDGLVWAAHFEKRGMAFFEFISFELPGSPIFMISRTSAGDFVFYKGDVMARRRAINDTEIPAFFLCGDYEPKLRGLANARTGEWFPSFWHTWPERCDAKVSFE